MSVAELERRHGTIRGADLHDLVVQRLEPRPHVRWLDLACGTGAVAERAAARGAAVTGIDLDPALLATARARRAALGLDIDYLVGDCENLDLPDECFDVVSSTRPLLFEPDRAATASEVARVTRPGGRIALAGEWGSAARVRELLGEWFELTLDHPLALGVRR